MKLFATIAILFVTTGFAFAQGFVGFPNWKSIPGYVGTAYGIEWCQLIDGNTIPCDGKEHIIPKYTIYEMVAPEGEQTELREMRKQYHLDEFSDSLPCPVGYGKWQLDKGAPYKCEPFHRDSIDYSGAIQ